jgi:hypothetical protein
MRRGTLREVGKIPHPETRESGETRRPLWGM